MVFGGLEVLEDAGERGYTDVGADDNSLIEVVEALGRCALWAIDADVFQIS